MKEVTKSGRNVEEAINIALSELQTTKENVDIHIVEEAKKGILGLGSKQAVVRVTAKEDPVEFAHGFLKKVTDYMGIMTDIKERKVENNIVLELFSKKAAVLIGKRGNTLNALQYLTNLAANRRGLGQVHFVLDVENYREKREKSLQSLAERLCKKVRQTGREITLEPMPSMERRIIHMMVKDQEGVTSYSKGENPDRKIVIAPADE